jgi:hypothetical protein
MLLVVDSVEAQPLVRSKLRHHWGAITAGWITGQFSGPIENNLVTKSGRRKKEDFI